MWEPSPSDGGSPSGSPTMQEEVVKVVIMEEMKQLPFPVAVLDDLSLECPVVACSDCLADLVGVASEQLIGRAAMSLLEGRSGSSSSRRSRSSAGSAPSTEADAEARRRACLQTYLFARCHEHLPAPPGEMSFVHSLASSFRGLLFLKRVRLENRCFIVVLLLELPPSGAAIESSKMDSAHVAPCCRCSQAVCGDAACEKEAHDQKSQSVRKKKAAATKVRRSLRMGRTASTCSNGGGRMERRRSRRLDARSRANTQESFSASSVGEEVDGEEDVDYHDYKDVDEEGNADEEHEHEHELVDAVAGCADQRMANVECILARSFWYESPLGRQPNLSSRSATAPTPAVVAGTPPPHLCSVGSGLLGAMAGFQSPALVLAKYVAEQDSGAKVSCDAGAEEVSQQQQDVDASQYSFENAYLTERSTTDLDDAVGKMDFAKQLSAESAYASTAYRSEVTKADSEDSSWMLDQASGDEAVEFQFMPYMVKAWDPDRYEVVRRIRRAARNQGCVCLMRDRSTGKMVAAKVMPNQWMQESPEAFIDAHPSETERPWMDIWCNHFLRSIDFPYVPTFEGVYRDSTHTSMITSFVEGGDLFEWATKLKLPPGPRREAAVKPIARQLALALRTLHDKSIAHRDLSCENVLLQHTADGGIRVQLIDFAAATRGRWSPSGSYGKPSYQAPEMFEGQHDSFASDAFAFGVVLYGLCLMDYPWMDLHGRGDKCVQFVRVKGFLAFMERKKLSRTGQKLVECISPGLGQLFAGLLNFNPAHRLSLGEAVMLEEGRKSIWDEPWFQV